MPWGDLDLNFDQPIERRASHSMKWDQMQDRYGISNTDGLPMWVADMDFPCPDAVREAVSRLAKHGVYGYFGDDRAYREAIQWWMSERHAWSIDPASLFSVHGLVNGTALCLQTWTEPGDGIVLFTPVYHMFAAVIRAAGRQVVECPLVEGTDQRYHLDLEAAAATLTGRERMMILCSPHNPGGRVWSVAELQALAEFAQRHDLLVVSDEIHHDLVYPGQQHTILDLAAPELRERLVLLTSASKTFNIAGGHVGQVIIPDPRRRPAFQRTLDALGVTPNAFGMHLTTAAYSPDGAAWLDALLKYLQINRDIFHEGISQIQGLRSMPIQATYLAWVDFSGTGLTRAKFTERVEHQARIATNHGPNFGKGGEGFLRFNLATQRFRVQEALQRLQEAFG